MSWFLCMTELTSLKLSQCVLWDDVCCQLLQVMDQNEGSVKFDQPKRLNLTFNLFDRTSILEGWCIILYQEKWIKSIISQKICGSYSKWNSISIADPKATSSVTRHCSYLIRVKFWFSAINMGLCSHESMSQLAQTFLSLLKVIQ